MNERKKTTKNRDGGGRRGRSQPLHWYAPGAPFDQLRNIGGQREEGGNKKNLGKKGEGPGDGKRK